jgi:hypothetical protein
MNTNFESLRILVNRKCLPPGFSNRDKKNDPLAELKKAIKEDPALGASYGRRVQIEASQETEHMKTESLSQLKELGNKFLVPFEMSTDNLQTQQNPNDGQSIQFRK